MQTLDSGSFTSGDGGALAVEAGSGSVSGGSLSLIGDDELS